MRGFMIGLLAAAGAVGAVSVAAAAPRRAPEVPPSQGRAAVEAAMRNAGVSDPWVLWGIWVAKGESNWKITANNHSEGERDAAGDLFDRLVAQGRWPCPVDKARYRIGSGGWFGQLAPLTSYHLIKAGVSPSVACDPKTAWRTPALGVTAHLQQVQGTIPLLPPGGTFLQLRALYGLPTRDPAAVDTPERRAQYSKTLKSAGIDPSFLDEQVPPLSFQV